MRASSCLVVAILMFATGVFAQSDVTAVSVDGHDGRRCTVDSPCRTFTRAISQTNAGGELIVLTSGRYDGPFVVDRGMSIVSAPGVHASVSAPPGPYVASINAPGGRVMLRGLTIYVSTSVGLTVSHASAAVLDDLTIEGIGNASNGMMTFADNTVMTNCRIRNTAMAIQINPAPVATSMSGALISGCVIDRATAVGILAENYGTATIRDTSISHSASAFQVGSIYPGQTCQMTMQNCTATFNDRGVAAYNQGAARMTGCTISQNATGVAVLTGGAAYSAGTNYISGNTTANVTGALTADPRM